MVISDVDVVSADFGKNLKRPYTMLESLNHITMLILSIMAAVFSTYLLKAPSETVRGIRFVLEPILLENTFIIWSCVCTLGMYLFYTVCYTGQIKRRRKANAHLIRIGSTISCSEGISMSLDIPLWRMSFASGKVIGQFKLENVSLGMNINRKEIDCSEVLLKLSFANIEWSMQDTRIQTKKMYRQGKLHLKRGSLTCATKLYNEGAIHIDINASLASIACRNKMDASKWSHLNEECTLPNQVVRLNYTKHTFSTELLLSTELLYIGTDAIPIFLWSLSAPESSKEEEHSKQNESVNHPTNMVLEISDVRAVVSNEYSIPNYWFEVQLGLVAEMDAQKFDFRNGTLQLESGIAEEGNKGVLRTFIIMPLFWNVTSSGNSARAETSGIDVLLTCKEIQSILVLIEDLLSDLSDHGGPSNAGAPTKEKKGALESKNLLPSGIDDSGSAVAIRCDLGLHALFLAVDLTTLKPCITPAVCEEYCCQFKVENIRGTKYFRIAIDNVWKQYLVLDEKQRLLFQPTTSLHNSHWYFEKEKKSGIRYLCSRSGRTKLNITAYGGIHMHKDSGTPIELITIGEYAGAKGKMFNLDVSRIFLRILQSKVPNPEEMLQEHLDESLDLFQMLITVKRFSMDSGLNQQLNTELSILVRAYGNEEGCLLPLFCLERCNICYCNIQNSLEYDSKSSLYMFVWHPMQIEINEVSVEVLCIILQGMGLMQYFPAKHVPLIQEALQIDDKIAEVEVHTKKRTTGQIDKVKHRKAISFESKWHFAEITTKISTVESPQCELLLGRIRGFDAEFTSLTLEEVDTLNAVLNIQRLDVDTHHPHASSFVCFRTKTKRSEDFLNLNISIQKKIMESNLAVYVRVSPIEVNVHEEVVANLISIILPFRHVIKSEPKAPPKKEKERAAKRIQKWFRKIRGLDNEQKVEKRKRVKAAKRIQRWFRKKSNVDDADVKDVPKGNSYHISCLDVSPLKISTEYHSTRSQEYSGVEDSLSNDLGTLLDVLGAPTVGMVNIHCGRILLRDADMTLRDMTRVLTQNLVKYALIAVAQETVEHNIPWLEGAVNEYFALEAEQASHDPHPSLDRNPNRARTFLSAITLGIPRMFIIVPFKILVKSGGSAIRQAGWSFLISVASDVTDSAIKGAETSGIRGVYEGIIISCARMLTTPPSQHMMSIWTSRNALTSGLATSFNLSDSVGMNDVYLEAYMQAIVDHLFKLSACEIAIVNSERLEIQNLPLLERDRNELIDYVESILCSEGLIEDRQMNKMQRAIKSSSTFSSRLRHLSQADRDPKKQLLHIAKSFLQNLAIVLVSQQMKAVLPFHKIANTALENCKSRRRKFFLRTLLSSGIMFGYRKFSWVIPTSFAKKVFHQYLLSIVFQHAKENKVK